MNCVWQRRSAGVTSQVMGLRQDLFVFASLRLYGRVRWVRGKKPIYYRRAQLGQDTCDRMLGRTPYGRMFSKFTTAISDQ